MIERKWNGHWVLRIWDPRNIDQTTETATYYDILLDSELWTLAGITGLDSSFASIPAEQTSEATGPYELSNSFAEREITIQLRVLDSKKAWGVASKVFVTGFSAWLMMMSGDTVSSGPVGYFPCRIQGFEGDRFEQGWSIEVNLRPYDGFLHASDSIEEDGTSTITTNDGSNITRFVSITDVPCFPRMSITDEENLLIGKWKGTTANALQNVSMIFQYRTSTDNPYLQGGETAMNAFEEQERILVLSNLDIPATALPGLVMQGAQIRPFIQIDCKRHTIQLYYTKEDGETVGPIDGSQYINRELSTWDWLLYPGQYDVYFKADLPDVISRISGAVTMNISVNPLYLTNPYNVDTDYSYVPGQIDPNLRPENIRDGVKILGVIGTMEEKLPDYTGPYEVTPDTAGQTLLTENKSLTDNIIIAPISPVNPENGLDWAKSAVDPAVITDSISDLDGGPVIAGFVAKDGWYTTGQHGPWRQAVIADEEKAKIIPENLREGVTILGVMGTFKGAPEEYTGPYTVTPSTTPQTLQTGGKVMTENVEIGAISPINPSNGIVIKQKGTDIMATPPDSIISGARQKVELYPFVTAGGVGWYDRDYSNQSPSYRVGLDPNEAEKIIPANIKKDVSILGIIGAFGYSGTQYNLDPNAGYIRITSANGTQITDNFGYSAQTASLVGNFDSGNFTEEIFRANLMIEDVLGDGSVIKWSGPEHFMHVQWFNNGNRPVIPSELSSTLSSILLRCTGSVSGVPSFLKGKTFSVSTHAIFNLYGHWVESPSELVGVNNLNAEELVLHSFQNTEDISANHLHESSSIYLNGWKEGVDVINLNLPISISLTIDDNGSYRFLANITIEQATGNRAPCLENWKYIDGLPKGDASTAMETYPRIYGLEGFINSLSTNGFPDCFTLTETI